MAALLFGPIYHTVLLHPRSRYEPPAGGGGGGGSDSLRVDDDDSQQSQRQDEDVERRDEEGGGEPAAAAAAAGPEEGDDKVPLLIELFEELKELTEADEAKNNHWRVRNYQKMVNSLKKYHENGWPPLVRSGDFMKMIEEIREKKAPGCPLYVVKDCTEVSNPHLILTSSS